MKANKLGVSVGQRRDNFVLGSLITSSEALNESHSAITHCRGSHGSYEKPLEERDWAQSCIQERIEWKKRRYYM